MIFITHILTTLIILKIFSINSPEILIFSFIFGIFIDLDELYTAYKFCIETKSRKIFKKNFFQRGIKRRT